MRIKLILASLLLLCVITPATAQVSISIRSANVSIGINVPQYPQLVRVPGYPVYYAPNLNSNYFFYDGYYWVYVNDNWYTSDWYNGPWYVVEPIYVPEFVLRIPVRYYRSPPRYFLSWQRDAAPRWDQHWGNDWSRRRSGWDQWNRNSAPAPAPLPVYQRQYSGDRYPTRVEQQRELQTKNYNYQPRTKVVRQEQTQPAQRAPVTGRATQEPSRNNTDARSNQRTEQTTREAAPQRNDKAQQPSKKQTNKDDEEDERNNRGKDQGR